VDPLAEKHFEISSYAYCGNNSVNRVDPDGRDWFVNNNDGNLIFIKGTSKLTREVRDRYGLGDHRYENLGKDDMFGKGLKETQNRNVLIFEGIIFSEKFMNRHGFVKAEKVKFEEMKFENTDYGHLGVSNSDPATTTTILDPLVKDSKISFVRSEQLNTKSNIKIDKAKSYTSSIETTSYDLIKPVGQSLKITSVYNNDYILNKWNNISSGIQAIFDIAPTLLKLIKR
jgi:hypothetical protein